MEIYSTTKNNKLNTFISVVIILVPAVVGIFVLAAWASIYSYGYDHFCHTLLSHLGKLHKEQEFKSHFLTKNKFNFILFIDLLVGLLFVCASIKIFKRRTHYSAILLNILNACLKTLNKEVNFIRNLERPTLWFLTILLSFQFLFFLRCVLVFPVSYDEAWTWLNFTSKSIITSATYYPAPNNHILFSILSNITANIPLGDSTFRMRIINVFISLITSYIFFRFLKLFFSEKLSIIALSIFMFSYPVALYGIQARGYALELMFSMLAIGSAVRLLLSYSKKYISIYTISVILGFYTMPSYLYLFLSLNIWCFFYFIKQENYPSLLKFVIADLVAAGAILCLYTPVFIISGISSVTSNIYVKSLGFQETISKLKEHIPATFNWLTGFSSYGMVITAILFLLSIFLVRTVPKNLKTVVQLMLFMLIIPSFFLILQRVIPFERTWIHLIIPLCFLIAFICSRATSLLNRLTGNLYIFSVLLTVMVPLFVWHFIILYKNLHKIDYESEEIFSNQNVISRISSISTNEVLSSDLLTYKIISKDPLKKVIVNYLQPGSQANPDALIISKDSASHFSLIKNYELQGKNAFIYFYIKAY